MTTQVLRVDASMRRDGSRTRAMADALVAKLEAERGPLQITRRDLADGVPFVDQDWIAANFTDPDARSAAQSDALAHSDSLLNELRAAQVLVIATPIYNFGVPAALKAWVDMVARARESFQYTANGPEGLLTGKTAFIVQASGGVAADSPGDFATPYLRFVLGFVGITDVRLVASPLRGRDGADADAEAMADIAALDVS